MNTPALVSRADAAALPQWTGPMASPYDSTPVQSHHTTHLWTVVRRYWWLALLVWLVLAVPTSIALWQMIKPGYIAVGAVRVSPYIASSPLPGKEGAQPTPFYTEFIRTQAELMKSSRVLARAAEDPRLRAYDWFRSLADQLDYLNTNVDVATNTTSQLVTVSVTHPDANAATDMVNAVIDAYKRVIDEDEEKNIDKSLKILKPLRDHTETLLRESQEKLAQLSADGATLTNEDDRKIMQELLASSRTSLAKFEADQLTLKAQLDNLKARPDPDEAKFKESIAVDADPQIEKWATERIRVQMNDNVLASRGATLEHPDRVEIRKQLKTLDQKIAARTAEIRGNRWQEFKAGAAVDRAKEVNRAEGDLKAVNQQIAALRGRVAEQTKAAQDVTAKIQPIVSLREQIAEAKESLKRYDERIQELDSQNLAPGRVAIGWNATTPRTAKVDRRPKFIAIANFGGLMLGALALVMVSRLRNCIESSDDLPQIAQPLVVGTVSNASQGTRGLQGRVGRKILGEEMRLVHANLLPPGRPQRRIMMVTSPTPANGKTSIAAHLALSLAKSGLEVLLIDADLRKRDLTGMFDIGFRPGLVELLQGQAPELVRPVELLPNFRVMGAGARLERNPVELLQRRHFREALDLLQDKFDCIIIDTPPTLVVADARLIAPSCDEVLCVVRAQVSSPKDISEAIDALRRIKGESPKIIVNGVDHKHKYYKYKFAYAESAEKAATDPANSVPVGDQFD